LGARFEGWNEHFRWAAWQRAFEEAGLEMDFYTHRRRALDETLPWDHIGVGVSKRYLAREYEKSRAGEIREDCRDNNCHACGILLSYADLRRDTPAQAWECPPLEETS
jgi:hypothetical protein